MKTEPFNPVNSLQLMAYVIKRCQRERIPLNITKLQKLMYCCYGSVLGRFGVRLTDEHPEAWQYGPVFPTALRSAQFFELEDFLPKSTADVEALPQDVLRLINSAIAHFGESSATELSKWSHLPGSPWFKASDGGKLLFVRLDDEDVRTYFRDKVLA